MSKFILFDFRCRKCDLKFEQMVKPDVKETPCPKCSSTGVRLISAPRTELNGISGDFPTASAKWERTRAQKQAQDKKFYADHGADKKHHSHGS